MAKLLGYSNDINPFGDSNLLQPFVWGKKKEKDSHEQKHNTTITSTHKRTELISEIEKVRKRRIQREEELAEMERLRDEEQRLRESLQYDDWQKKEEIFVLEQISNRSKIRLVDRRAQPVDLIAKNILLIETFESYKITNDYKVQDLNFLELVGESSDPIDIMKRLSLKELRELQVDVDSYLQLEKSKSSPYVSYWENLLSIIQIEIQKLSSNQTVTSIHESIINDVTDLLKGKTSNELDNLQHDIEKNLSEGKGGDVEYWELLKIEVKLQRAKSIVRNIHKQVYKKQNAILQDIREEISINNEKSKPLINESDEYKEKIPLDVFKVIEDLDIPAVDTADREEKMDISDEVVLLDNINNTAYPWKGKYTPRKPRYFNRVRTGWDRTKYKLTHYDHDNPPPKMIQGYKFTIFYPDLIDKLKTPRYFIEPCAESAGGNDFVIIRFHRII